MQKVLPLVPSPAPTSSLLLVRHGRDIGHFSNSLTDVVSVPASLAVTSSSGVGAPGFTSNQFGFGISSAAGTSFVVELPSNLHTWQPLSTNTFGAGPFQVVEPGSSTNPIRFYRTRY